MPSFTAFARRAGWAVALLVIISFFSISVTQPLHAQTPRLVKDINTSRDVGSSNPASFVQVGSSTFFTAYVPGEEYQLWKTNGTPSGTALVVDKYFPSANSLTASNGRLFFLANPNVPDGFNSGVRIGGDELWTSDGTASGTVRLKSISCSPVSVYGPISLVDVNGTLFFTADNGTNGSALWKSDGTAAGTVMVKDLYPYASPASLTAVNGTLYFVTSGGSATLWKSDGTAAGTVIVQSYGGAVGMGPTALTPVNGTLFFTAFSANGNALWKTNGTAESTVVVKDAINAQDLVSVNGTLFFQDIDVNNHYVSALWKSNGTTEGTVLVVPLCTDSCDISTSPRASNFTNVSGTLYYSNQGGLWKSDGTAAGTVQVSTGIFPSSLVALNGAVFFAGSDPTDGVELWKSDGTAAGTGIVKDICPGTCAGLAGGGAGVAAYFIGGSFSGISSNLIALPTPSRALTVSNGKLFFMACEPVNSCEPWTSDGTAGGTALLKNIVVDTSSQISSGVDLNGSVLFFGFDGASTGLWKTDGTDAGTVPIMDGLSGYPYYYGLTNRNNFVKVNGTVFFQNYDATHSTALWKTDGTTGGTVKVKSVDLLNGLTAMNGFVFFTAFDGNNGLALWKSDGTGAGTVVLKDFPLQTSCSGSVCGTTIMFGPDTLVPVNGNLFLVGDDGTGVAALWKSDGTSAGTVALKSFPPPDPSTCSSNTSNGCASFYAPRNLTAVGNTLFFTSDTSLWKRDGTVAGTVRITENAMIFPMFMVDVNGTLFFADGMNLWKSDGTDAGTVVVKDLSSSSGSTFSTFSSSSSASAIAANVNGTLLFANHGTLWKSDGTTNGTVQVKDIPALDLTNVNGELYFEGKDANGVELWKSDGTSAGTVMVADINPSANGSFSQILTWSNGRLFFTANDGTHGTELWSLITVPTSVSLTSSANPVVAGQAITFTASLMSMAPGAFTGWMEFLDGTRVMGDVAVNSGGVATLSTSSLTVGTHSITALYNGDRQFPDAMSTVLSQVVQPMPDYRLTANPTSATIRSGQSATFVITATADQNFTGTVSFSCGTLPFGVNCSFSPATLNPTGGGQAQTTLTVTTTAQTAVLAKPELPGMRGTVLWAGLGSAGVFGFLFVGRTTRRKRMLLCVVALILLILSLTACGGGSHTNPNGTPTGTQTLQVTATATAGTTGGNTAAHQLAITIDVQ